MVPSVGNASVIPPYLSTMRGNVMSEELGSKSNIFAAKKMTLKSLVVTNRCDMPVYFREGHNAKIDVGSTIWFQDDASLKIGNRLSFSYDDKLFATGAPGVGEKMQFLEMAISKWPLKTPIKQGGFNFVSQAGFIDMNLEVAGWKDRPGSELVCKDARAKTTYKISDCESLDDAVLETRNLPDGKHYLRCKSKIGSASTTGTEAAPGCTAEYALYVDDHSHQYDTSARRWIAQARSVGSTTHGFTKATFYDGSSAPSTRNGRENSGVAVNFECWELPCLRNTEYCKEHGYVSTGNQGFMYCPGTGDFTIGTLEVITCSNSDSKSSSVGIMIAIVLLLLSALGGAYFFLRRRSAARIRTTDTELSFTHGN